MSLVDSVHNPLPYWLPWFRRMYSRFPLSPLFDLSTGELRCILQEHACARWVRHCGFVFGAHHQLSTARQSSQSPQLSLCLQEWNSAQTTHGGFLLQGGNFQTPLPKLKEVRARSRWCLLVWYFPRYPSFSMIFFYPFPICPVCSAPEWMLREKQSEAGCTVLCLTLSLPLTHSCCRPPFSQFLTAPPHPFIFYLLLSFPLALTDRLRYALLWLSTITVVPLPNHVNQEESPPKLHRGTNSSR